MTKFTKEKLELEFIELLKKYKYSKQMEKYDE